MIKMMRVRGGGQTGGGTSARSSLRRSRISTGVALLTLGMTCAAAAQAQSLETQAAMGGAAGATAAAAAAAGSAAPTENTVINLINLLVKRGVLTKQNAQDLIAEAQNEAAQAKAAQAKAVAAVPVPSAGATVVNAPTQPGDVAVPYIPQVVRDQIRDQVKQEVVAQAKAEDWAQPNTFPDWISRITVSGDVRVRDEGEFFSPRNETGVTNFAAINSGTPYDVNPNTNTSSPPLLNTTQDRNEASVRARLGVTAILSDQLSTGVQLASGDTDGPASTTTLLGNDFGKQNIWLNQAWVKYQPVPWLNVTAGRFDNPFFSSDLLFSKDLEFDGIATSFRHLLPGNDNVTLFGTAGAFPIQYSSDGFLGQNADSTSSNTKWMLGAQLGAEWKIDDQNKVKGAIAYYDFMNLKGAFSAPCALYLGATSCSTDDDAPAFMQKGNTLIELRNIAQNPNLAAGDTPEPELFGLAYNYRLFDAKLEWDTKLADRFKVRLDGEYVRNLAYNTNNAFSAASTPINNYNNAGSSVSQSDYKSGPNGFLFKVTLGEPDTLEKGQWNFSVTYKYLEPDAVLDAFTDPDFNLGGTNAKGYIIGAQYAVARNAWLSARYLSAREVYGPPLSIDVLQLELDAHF
ncbi:MAG: putative porin [Pseudomonadota bacterium]|uniref:putative porin n=2 Tax=Burkholderiales TaxID=80840 RepID=UPI0010F8D65D|nr:putative porin [Burkholderia sp. 4M9327F10]